MTTFSIFPKSSASPTIFIRDKIRNQGLKIWYKDYEKPDESSKDEKDIYISYRALEYENEVYKQKIRPILRDNIDAPFLPYVGEAEITVKELIKYLNIQDRYEYEYFLVSMMIYLANPGGKETKFTTYNPKYVEKYKRKLESYDISKYEAYKKNILKTNIKMIILPFIESYSFSEVLDKNKNDINSVKYFLNQIIDAIYAMYTNKLVHNDLHSGNILIDKNTKKVLMFDYDRAYMDGVDNEFLTRQKNTFPCDHSSCNIYNGEGYAIDFYKILYYILSTISENEGLKLLHETFNIVNPNKVRNILTRDPFFQSVDASNQTFETYLQFPDEEMLDVIQQFGPIEIIKTISSEEHERAVKRAENSANMFGWIKLAVGVLGVAVGLNTLFGFQTAKFNLKALGKQSSMLENVNKTKESSMLENVNKNKVKQLSDRYKNDTLKVKDVILIHKLYNIIIYGKRSLKSSDFKEIKESKITKPDFTYLHTKNIGEIIELNNIRNDYLKKHKLKIKWK